MIRGFGALVVALFASGIATPLEQASLSTVTIVASSNLGDKLSPEIHLYPLGSRQDVWPTGRVQTANRVPFGYYDLEAFVPGFRPFHRRLDVGHEPVTVRVVLLPSDEAHGPMELSGRLLGARNPSGLWAVAFPLTGSPSDIAESPVNYEGRFRITTTQSGPYVLTVVRGDKLIISQAVYIGYKNREIDIELHE